MTRFDVMMGKPNEIDKKNKLTLILEEDDDLLTCIKQGLVENELQGAEVVDANGEIKDAIVSEDGNQVTFDEIEILKAKGKFKMGGGDLWGNLEVFTGGKKPIKGKLLKGKAKENFELILEY
jgi:hypothetical protein